MFVLKSFVRSLSVPLLLAGLASPVLAQSKEPGGGTLKDRRPPRPTVPNVEEFDVKSECVSAFWGKDRSIESGVVLPLGFTEKERLPVCYSIHGFGGNQDMAWYLGPQLQSAMDRVDGPRMIYVFLNAQFEWGHHEFADSRCNGPWGKALTTEFIPALEKKYHAIGQPWARFVTGHSSGGWSSLWLQVTYPDFFGGCWATAPDSVDFRDFTGIDIYHYDNAFVDPNGETIMLMRRNGKFVNSIQDFVKAEQQREPVGGQFFSFNAVFSEKGEDGMPKQLFDWKSGAIDPEVADSWKPYDISLTLRENWKTLGPKLAGKIHVWVGTLDTYRLEGATILMKEELEKLHADVDILLVEGRDHSSLINRHTDLWPDGMLARVHREMFASYKKHAPAEPAAAPAGGH